MTPPHYRDESVTLYAGDALDVLRTLPDQSVDAVVTDPPAGIAFMGKQWDGAKGGREQWSAWLAAIMAEALRVTKPGGHALVWALPRTAHWTACGLEDAGWQVRDRITHLFGSGFPKSLDVGKAIDRAGGDPLAFHRFAHAYAAAVAASPYSHTDIDRHLGIKSSSCYWARDDHRGGMPPRHHWEQVRDLLGLDASFEWLYAEAEREVLETRRDVGGRSVSVVGRPDASDYDVTAPATDAARRWDGWGTALKPAAEDWWLCRKPLEGTVAGNVTRWGTGALNVDGCRVGMSDTDREAARVPTGRFSGSNNNRATGGRNGETFEPAPAGRWPTNALLDTAAAQQLDRETGDAVARFFPVLSGACGDASTEDASTSAGRRTASNGDSPPTAGPGNRPTDPSRPATRSTTSTATRSTTTSATSPASPPNGTTTTTSDYARTTAPSTASNTAAANAAATTSPSTPSLFDGPEPSTATAASAPRLTAANGSPGTATSSTPAAAPATPPDSAPSFPTFAPPDPLPAWRGARLCMLSGCGRPSASTADGPSPTTRATTAGTVPAPATTSSDASNARAAASAVGLCDSCGTAIARSLARTQPGPSVIRELGLPFTASAS
jgi:hypothetical protein